MKKSLIVFLGSLALSLGLLTLNHETVGVSVSQSETNSIVGGTCYTEDANADYKSVCSTNCGFSSVHPKTEHSSGKSAAGLRCKSNDNCTYGGVGNANCSCEG